MKWQKGPNERNPREKRPKADKSKVKAAPAISPFASARFPGIHPRGEGCRYWNDAEFKRGHYKGTPIMSLDFPNRSRCYDATLRAVRFWGHDGPMEASFFVNEDALKRIQPEMPCDEAGLLGAFNSHSALIHATAAKVYRRGRKGSYELIPGDF